MENTKYAYLAGLIDGEGHIGAYGQQSPGPRLELSMTDRTTIEWLVETFGGCIYTPKVPKPNAKQYWKWTVTRTILRQLLPKVLPYCITKKRHVEIALEILSLRDPNPSIGNNPERVTELCLELKNINRRGKLNVDIP